MAFVVGVRGVARRIDWNRPTSLIFSEALQNKIADYLDALEAYDTNNREGGECQSYSVVVEIPKFAILNQFLADLGLEPEPTDPVLLPPPFDDLPTPARRRPVIPATLRARVLVRDGFACVKCARVDFLSMDHVVPISKGGATTFENLQTLCRSCNSSKGDRM